MTAAFPRQSTCVAIERRAVLIEGAPGIGKSSLALALIDRGAILVGDDSILLEMERSGLVARPHPNTLGLLEVRNLGLLRFPVLQVAPVAILLELHAEAPRYIEHPEHIQIGGMAVPHIRLWPQGGSLALKAELALQHYGLESGGG